MANNYDDEPIIEVTATPVGGQPSTQVFPYSTESATVSGSTVPQVAGEQPDTAIQVAAHFLDNLKGKYSAEKYDLVVRTLYVITHCRKLDIPFPYTALTKLSNEKKINTNYGYSYALVYEYCIKCGKSPCMC